MRAVVLEDRGGPDVLRVRDVAPRAPVRSEVRIAVQACGVCFHDVVVRNGTLRMGVELPAILGHEIAGIVESVGPAVSGFRPGDRVASTAHSHVCGHCRHCNTGQETSCPERRFMGDAGLNGGYAELVCIGEENLVRLPEAIGFAEGAIVACTIGTELNAINDVARVAAGERVIVTGAGGGLGLHGVQLAKLAGAFTIGITTSTTKVARIRAAGADEVIVTCAGEDFSAAVKAVTDGEGADVVIDNVGTPVFHAARRSLAACGRYVLVGQVTGDFISLSPAQLFLRNISLLSAKGVSRRQLATALELVRERRITPIVSGVLPLEAAAEAHRAIEGGGVVGRLVLTPS